MKRMVLIAVLLGFGVVLAVHAGSTVSRDVNNLPIAGEGQQPLAQTIIFPNVGDVRFNQTGTNFWNQGDYVQGQRQLSGPASQVDMTLQLEQNVLSCDTQDHVLILNGSSVGAFSISAGETQVTRSFSGFQLSGLITMRIETTRTVASGCGSAGFPDGVSTFVFDSTTWAFAYERTPGLQADLELLRRYRDEVLSGSAEGSEWVGSLYARSGTALQVLLQNPELMAELGELVSANRDAIARVVAGREAKIDDTDAVLGFLEKVRAVAPASMQDLIDSVISELREHRGQRDTLFGFRVE